MLPSEFDELGRYPKLRRLLRHQLDMQIADLRVLLQLPRGDLEAGCNFAAASVLFNLVSGCAACFFSADVDRIIKAPRSGRPEEFKNMLRLYYPWEAESVKPTRVIEILYHYARTPLVHALGIDRPDRANIALGKRAIPIERILKLEDSPARPAWLPATVTQRDDEHGELFVISVPTLYWGFHRTLHRLFSDEQQVAKAERFAARVRLANAS